MKTLLDHLADAREQFVLKTGLHPNTIIMSKATYGELREMTCVPGGLSATSRLQVMGMQLVFDEKKGADITMEVNPSLELSRGRAS